MKKATVYATAMGVYTFSLNGTHVTLPSGYRTTLTAGSYHLADIRK